MRVDIEVLDILQYISQKCHTAVFYLLDSPMKHTLSDNRDCPLVAYQPRLAQGCVMFGSVPTGASVRLGIHLQTPFIFPGASRPLRQGFQFLHKKHRACTYNSSETMLGCSLQLPKTQRDPLTDQFLPLKVDVKVPIKAVQPLQDALLSHPYHVTYCFSHCSLHTSHTGPLATAFHGTPSPPSGICSNATTLG